MNRLSMLSYRYRELTHILKVTGTLGTTSAVVIKAGQAIGFLAESTANASIATAVAASAILATATIVYENWNSIKTWPGRALNYYSFTKKIDEWVELAKETDEYESRQEASERIKKCYPCNTQDRSYHLDLSSLGLTSLPPAIQELTWLSSLKLFDNQIRDIDPLANLTALYYLDLRNNPITSIPESLANLSWESVIHAEETSLSEKSIQTFTAAIQRVSPPDSALLELKAAVQYVAKGFYSLNKAYLGPSFTTTLPEMRETRPWIGGETHRDRIYDSREALNQKLLNVDPASDPEPALSENRGSSSSRCFDVAQAPLVVRPRRHREGPF